MGGEVRVGILPERQEVLVGAAALRLPLLQQGKAEYQTPR
jgi:hypothetical protein